MEARSFALTSILVAACAHPPASTPRPRGALSVTLVPQLGHAHIVTSIAVSPDGRLLATGSYDRTIRLWEIESGAMLRTFAAGDVGIDAVAFSRDGHHLISRDGKVRIWEIETGKLVASSEHEVSTYTGHGDAPSPIVASPDGLVIAPSDGGSVSVFDEATAKHRCDVTGVAAVATSAMSVIAATGTKLVAWNIETCTELAPVLPEQATAIASLVGVDDKLLAIGFADGRLEVWDRTTGTRRVAARDPRGTAVAHLQVSADGKHAVSVTSETSAIALWDLERGTPARVVEVGTGAMSVAIAPAGTDVYAAGVDHAASRWSFASGTLVARFVRVADSLGAISISPDGRYLLAGAITGFRLPDDRRHNTQRARLWRLSDLGMARTFAESLPAITATTFSPDGSLAVTGSEDGSIRAWSVATGARVHDFAGASRAIKTVSVSPSGRFLLGGGEDTVLRLWDLRTGALVKEYPPETMWITASSFLFDDTLAMTGSEGGIVRLWDLTSRSLGAPVFQQPPFRILNIAMAKDRRSVLWSAPYSVTIANLAVEEPAHTLTTRGGPAAMVDAHTVLSVGKEFHLGLWNTSDGKLVREFLGQSFSLDGLAVTPDGKYAVTASDVESTLTLWRLDTGDSLTLVAAGDDWVVYTPDGYYDGSRGGGRLVTAVQGTRAFRIEQLALRNNRPDVILERMGLGSPPAIAYLRAKHDQRLRRLGLDDKQVAQLYADAPTVRFGKLEQHGKMLDLELEFDDSAAGLVRFNMFVNGVPLHGADGAAIRGNHERVATRVELSAGDNHISASVTNANGVESLHPTRTVTYHGPSNRNLYFVGFGVSAYRDPALKLAYAAKDVGDLAVLVAKMERRGTFDHVFVKPFTDAAVTRDSFAQAKAFLSRSTVDDTVVVFISGHGAHDADTYYFLTADSSASDLATTATPFETVAGVLDGLAARDRLLLVDTCESGEPDPDQRSALEVASAKQLIPRGIVRREHRAAAPPAWRGELDRMIFADLTWRLGAVVFSSSRGSEYSYESSAIEHGFFTSAILGALTGAADRDRDGRVSFDELRTYVQRSVPATTFDLQHPAVERDNADATLVFPSLPP